MASEDFSKLGLAIVIQGVDERAAIDPRTGRNKYHLDPLAYHGLFNRGSCTNSTLTDFSAGVVSRLLRDLRRQSFHDVRADQADRLKYLLNYEGQDRFECFFGPSGSDLAYLPIAFARMLHPGRQILSLLTCPEELGAGTLLAAEGRYFMTVNQFGEHVEQGAHIDPATSVRVMRFKARDERGAINDHRGAILEAIATNRDAAIVGNLVIGSKSGIEDNVDFIEHVSDDVLWVVDLCQFRNSKRLVNKLLDLGCMVMITGSKFYEGPPFSGVMLVPKQLTERLRSCDASGAALLGNVFAQADCPECLPDLRAQLRPHENYGLLARMECALAEMEAFDSISPEITRDLIAEWNHAVVQELQRHDCFELIPNQSLTNPSIISFRVRRDGCFLGKSELDTLFRDVVLHEQSGLMGYHRVSIGQPVNYGDRSFIRIAIGAHGIRTLLALPQDRRYDNDARLVEILVQAIRQPLSAA